MSVIENTKQFAPTGTWAADPVHSNVSFEIEYAGVNTSALHVESSLDGGLDAALRTDAARVHVLANYTAMLDVRDLLAARGYVDSVWR